MDDLTMLQPNYTSCRIEFLWHFIGKDGKVKTLPFWTKAVCVIPDFLTGNIQHHSLFLMN